MIQILFDFAVFPISNIPSGVIINEGVKEENMNNSLFY